MICTDKSLEYELRLQDIEAPNLIKTASLLLLFRLDFRIIFLDFERGASLEMCRCEDFYFDETLQLGWFQGGRSCTGARVAPGQKFGLGRKF